MSKKNRKKLNITEGKELRITFSNKKLVESLNYIKNHKKQFIYGFSICIVIVVFVFIAKNYIPLQNNNSNKIDDGNSLNNTDKIKVQVGKEVFEPSIVQIKANRFYDFTFVKSSSSNCEGLLSRDLNIRIDFQTVEKTVPFRINTPGEYSLDCYGENSSMKLIVN